MVSAGAPTARSSAAPVGGDAGATRRRACGRGWPTTPPTLRARPAARARRAASSSSRSWRRRRRPWLLARWLASGAPLALPEPDGDAERDRREVAPTTLVASAAWLDRLWLETEARLPAPGTLARRLVDRALERALAAGVEAPLARLIVLGPLARGLGLDRVRSAVVVGEPLAPAARRLLAALGVLSGPPAPPATSNPLPSVEARTAA